MNSDMHLLLMDIARTIVELISVQGFPILQTCLHLAINGIDALKISHWRVY